MQEEQNVQEMAVTATINPKILFIGSCLGLISTSVAFGVITSMMGDFKSVFTLSNAEAGWIGGASIWGFTISIFIFGPLVDALGMGKLLRFSFLAHLLGPVIMIFANGFWALFAGALIISLANGTIEAVCNPLVATIYPDKKAQKLNQFHVWFPGGIVIGGLLSFFIDKIPASTWGALSFASWQIKLALILVPTVIYGILFTGKKFPKTERVELGLSFGQMVKATFLRPLFIVLFICMGLTATIELGPGRWMGEAMGQAMAKFAGGNAGILVLVYGCGLMAILRYFAGHALDRFSPTGLLMGSAILAGLGLFMLTYAENAILILVIATVYYVGVCYFWPTMLGVAAERIPKGGALALSLLGGWGMAVVGLISVPVMGIIADNYAHEKLPSVETAAVIQEGSALLAAVTEPENQKAYEEAVTAVEDVQASLTASGEVPKVTTSKALRGIATYCADSPTGQQAAKYMAPADAYGNTMSFRWVASLSIILVIVFGILYAKDRTKGGCKTEKID